MVLASSYAQVEGIEFAEESDFYVDGDDITSQQVGMYTFKRGWGDCSAGCTNEHFWEFAVSGGNVTLLAEYGTPITGVGDTPHGASAS